MGCMLKKTGDNRELSRKDQALQASSREMLPSLRLRTH